MERPLLNWGVSHAPTTLLPAARLRDRFQGMAHPLFDFTRLTPSQRVDLAIALWDSLPADSAEPPITDAQRAELLRRAEGYRRDPGLGSPWADVRARIEASRRHDR
jgi:putative addiction module component (TIGR02574 family)